MTKALQGRVALVTGGSRGIGRAICTKLAGLGAHVVVNFASKPDAAEETVKLCVAEGGSAEAVGFNVGESGAVDAAIDGIKERHGKLDILVNNAGITHDGLFMRMKDEDWNNVLQINLNGAFYCARAASKIMMKARYGRIINISSVVGEMGNPGQAPYVTSKAGLIGLTKALARELASRNITVNAVTPGFIDTDMTTSLDEKLKAGILAGIPLARLGSAAEVGGLVAFLGGEEASYITGEVLHVTGGLEL